MPSTSAVEARPVRRPPKSCLRASTAPCIRRLMSPVSMLVLMDSLSVLDDGRGALSRQHLGKVAGLTDVEDDDRNFIVSAQGDGRGVHDLEVVAKDLGERQM